MKLRISEVIIPQYDLGHYVQMIGSEDVYAGVRLQRLDHWLCANATKGLRVLGFFGDYETAFAGHAEKRISPRQVPLVPSLRNRSPLAEAQQTKIEHIYV